ncbi:hypothetical protein SAMN04490202_5240 [Pseudomonas reinekei]|jgi:hypothetical protein|uniref:Uncharacterized protein n=1 Tax=Pseudomonas reinekei TaxID=395598 RepID=A0A1H0U9S7_PSERE|nr:hypothetical protein [Pseudomonas reinekei]KAB0487942.1 hypothetical protein F7R15_03660 [Pseudomonas reinekei]OLU05379.1 hypothetical protein BVK86_03655 [Pseudomonas reinekei]SDP62919.1 hypothetical protein SAMN04490202_5240 [Pseudomonas reinekei]
MNTLMSIASGVLLMSALTLAQAEEPLGCVDVSVGGYKAPDYNCLSQQMGNNPEGAAAAQKNLEAMNVPINKRPPNQVGLATPAATSTRMGNTFGTSVKPQRPPAP